MNWKLNNELKDLKSDRSEVLPENSCTADPGTRTISEDNISYMLSRELCIKNEIDRMNTNIEYALSVCSSFRLFVPPSAFVCLCGNANKHSINQQKSWCSRLPVHNLR